MGAKIFVLGFFLALTGCASFHGVEVVFVGLAVFLL
jgi:hypothetical protein